MKFYLNFRKKQDKISAMSQHILKVKFKSYFALIIFKFINYIK